MNKQQNKISNLDLPIAEIIREALSDLSNRTRKDILRLMTEDEFISQRVDLYLAEFETAMHHGADELGCKEIAMKECLSGISENHG